MFTILDFDFGGDIMQITEFPYTTSNVVGTIRRDNQFDGLVFILLLYILKESIEYFNKLNDLVSR